MADKRFREIKGILSDLDDTLYNFSGIQEQALAETALLAASCLDVKKEEFLDAYQKGREEIKNKMTVSNNCSSHITAGEIKSAVAGAALLPAACKLCSICDEVIP